MVLTSENFLIVKQFILRCGDRMPYGNRYNDNPHYEFSGFDVFLDPSSPLNIECDPAYSDFNVVVIRDWRTNPSYLRVKISDDQAALELPQEHETRLARYFDEMLEVAARGCGGDG